MSAISVNNITFSYNSNPILENLTSYIPVGKMYALLGPSGAGKTTLLRLILGRIKPSEGSISVLGTDPGINNRLIGYMPQDTALCMTFTVYQTMKYFANIFRLSNHKFKQRKQLLETVFQLPEDDKVIKELSGGQQRRVSLALAFLNSPQLAILDEPTVGVDPVLGNTIWDYLNQCCNEGMTVVIVTHYIKEAAVAHRCGIMRNGRLMEEDDPMILMAKYEETNLENVFIKLAHNQQESIENSSNKDNNNNNNNNNKNTASFRVLVENNKNTSISNKVAKDKIVKNWSYYMLNFWILLLLVQKNFAKYIKFDVTFLIFLIPAFQVLLMCVLYGKETIEIKAAVFNEEPDPHYSKQLFSSIEKFDVYLVKPVYYNSFDAAIEAVKDGSVGGAIWIHKNYSEALDSRVLVGQDVDNDTLYQSNLHLYLDSTNFYYYNGMVDSLRQTVFNLISHINKENNISQEASPIELKETIYAENARLADFLFPGYLISFLYLSQVSISAQLLIQERKDGLFERSLVAGVSHELVFLSHFVTNVLLSIVQLSFMFLIAFGLFTTANYGSVPLVVFLNITQAANAVAIGLLISAIVSEGFVAVLVSIFITFSQLFCSGAIFSKEMMKQVARKIFYFSPIAMPVESLRNVMLRGWDMSYFYVFHGFALNVGTSAVFIIAAIFIFKRNS